VRLAPGEERTPEARPCQLWIVLQGQGTVNGQPYRPAEVWLMPENGEKVAIRAAEESTFLRTWTP